MTKKVNIQKHWAECFMGLLNADNDREETPDADKVDGPVIKIRTEKVRKALCDMKMRNAAGPSGIVVEEFKKLEKEGII